MRACKVSPDRIDHKLRYVKGIVQLICVACNLMRGGTTLRQDARLRYTAAELKSTITTTTPPAYGGRSSAFPMRDSCGRRSAAR